MRGAVGKRIVLPLHIFGSLLAGMVVSTVAWRNFSPCARWPLLLLASPACIFNLVSPPALLSSRWRGRICRLLPAGCCRSLLRRRAFLISFLRRRYRFHGGGDEFVSFCPLAAAVLRLAGVHFLFCFSAGAIVFTVAWTNLLLFARWLLPFFASPACKKGAVRKSIALHRGRCVPCGSHLPLQLDGQRQPSCLRSMLFMELCSNSILRGKRHQPLFQDGFWMQPSCGC